MDLSVALLWLFALFVLFLLIRWHLERYELCNLERRAVLITGCDTGFGRDLAIRCAGKGMPVFAGCIRPESIEELRNASQNFGTPIDAFVMDVASDESVAKAKKYLEYRTAEYGGELIN
ncbi:hypothetical protein GCK32_001513 [Trichostrongylus colubriformis]|uniref:Uncharacterized protein n=1 Tax=Trichostrongylus colubriformis TaxID=6319 RepID=A0AAN8IN25_TRICO